MGGIDIVLSDVEKKSLLVKANAYKGKVGNDIPELEQALESYNRIIDNSSPDPYYFSERADVRYLLSLRLGKSDLLDEAVNDVNRAIGLNPGEGAYYLSRGQFMWEKLNNCKTPDEKQRESIISDFRSCLSRNPTECEAWLDSMAFSIVSGSYDEAISLYGQCKPYIGSGERSLERAFIGCLALVLAGDPLEDEDKEALYNRTIRINRFRARIAIVLEFVKGMLGKDGNKEKSARLVEVSCLFINHSYDGTSRGNMLRTLMLYEQALDAYNEALELDPNYFLALKGKSIVLYKHLNRCEEAYRYINKAIMLRPDNADVRNEKGNILWGLDRYAEALDTYNMALKFNPNYEYSLRNSKNIQKKISELEELLQLYKVRKKSRYQDLMKRGEILYKLCRYREALQCINTAIRTNRDDCDLWCLKSRLQRGLGHSIRALLCINRAIKIGSKKIEAAGRMEAKPCIDLAKYWVDMGEILEEYDRYAEAIFAYEQAVAYDPKNTFAESSRKDLEKAYDKATETDPNHSLARRNTGYLMHKLKRSGKTLIFPDKALELNDNDSNVWNEKGNELLARGQYSAAMEAFSKVIDLAPNSALGWGNKGAALKLLDRPTEALQFVDKALELDMNDSNAWNTKGAALQNLGHYDEAMKAYKKAVALKPEFAIAKSNIEVLQKLLN
jgi:tetratricopeptide (TPR) repeat protein